MKLLRYLVGQDAAVGIVKDGGIVPLASISSDYSEVRQIAAGGSEAIDRLTDALASAEPQLDFSAATLLAPIERPGKYLAIGMNYSKHAEEALKLGVKVPERQLWFNKQTTCVSGPFDPIEPGVTE